MKLHNVHLSLFALFPGFPHLQFLITRSIQIQDVGKGWE